MSQWWERLTRQKALPSTDGFAHTRPMDVEMINKHFKHSIFNSV